MANKKLWSPSNSNTNFDNYINYLKSKKIYNYKNYRLLHHWSIKNKNSFWKSIWDFTDIQGKLIGPILKNKNSFKKSIFFDNCKINYTNNLLKKNDDKDAIVFFSEQNFDRRISWKNLNLYTQKLSNFFVNSGIKKGDRIAAVLPNIPESVISFLATSKLGAIWSSCSSDFGSSAIIDRFEQISPKILIVSDCYFYNNKKIETLKKIKEVKLKIKSIKKIIVIPYKNKLTKYKVDFKYINWLSIISKNYNNNLNKTFNFNTPLYILYTSGTTGKPKCIVHGAGGSLIQHKKEHIIHCNIKENDKVFYFTSCGWMMWNWLVSCLASKATIYLYDGSPFYPKKDNLFKIVEKEQITFFGTGAKYLDSLKQSKIVINKKFKLKKLRTIASTGSPLVHETFSYVYKNIKKNVHLSSISGGTDIVSCFVLGNPNMPVYAGEIQCKALGMEVEILDNKGKKIINKKGELVCKSTFPSKPLYFWKDKNNILFYKTYFNKFSNIWHHGDYAKETNNNGFIIYGRSDATLNSGGIRIGTAEIYRVVENISGILECIAVEQQYKNDTRIILFLKLDNNYKFNDNLVNLIKFKIKNLLSPKYVPALFMPIKDIPKTKSGKIVELIIKNILNNEKIKNINSLQNPECLDEYRKKIKLIA